MDIFIGFGFIGITRVNRSFWHSEMKYSKEKASATSVEEALILIGQMKKTNMILVEVFY
jgi:hypothetical protein